MWQKINETIKEQVINLRNNGYKYREIIDCIHDEFNRNISVGSIYNIIDSWAIDELIDAETEAQIEEELLTKAQKSRTKQYRSKIDRAVQYSVWVDEIAKRFSDALDVWDFPTLYQKDCDNKDCQYSYHEFVFVWDLHFWRSSGKLYDNWVRLIHELCNKEWVSWYTFFLMWDLIESPRVAGIHEAQILEMDYLWIQQALGCVDMLAWWFKQLISYGIKFDIVWLNGNHARMSKDRDGDPERIVWCFMYEMLKKIFPDTNIRYSKDGVIQYDYANYHFILSHWDWWFNSKKDINIVQALWQIGKLNIIASWHWHNSQLTQWNGYIRLQIPSLNQQSEYEKNKFIAKWQPWYVVLSEGVQSPEISFKFLPRTDD